MNPDKIPTGRAWKTAIARPPSPTLIAGVATSAVLIVYVVLDGPGAHAVRWLALIPALVGLLDHALSGQAAELTRPSLSMAEELQKANTALRKQVQDLEKLHDFMLALGASFDRNTILDELNNAITNLLQLDRGLVMLVDEQKNALVFGTYTHAAPDAESQFMLEQLEYDLDTIPDDPLISRWFEGTPVMVEDVQPYLSSRLNWVLTTLDLQMFYSVPLQIGSAFKGVILVDNMPTRLPITQEQRSLLDALAAYLAITLENARLYQLTDEQLSAKVEQLEILNRIDRELNHTLSVDRVLNLTLDWALRFTGSQSAAVALVDEEEGVIRFVAGYGHDPEQWKRLQDEVWSLDRGITARVARSGHAERIADVNQDPDYVEIVPGVRSQMSVPVVREDRVIAVISLESQDPDAFTQDNLDFVQRLAVRAAAAIDNANLFDETLRERHKLELILSSTADAVIVIGHDGRLVLVNQAALAAFHLPPKEQYTGRLFEDVFEYSRLMPLYKQAQALKHGLIEELSLGDDRTFHVSMVPAPEVGWTIVSHDITPFKETDQLKNELLATTSHDLKNPLGSILGYVDLINMTNKLNEQGQEYMRRVHTAVAHMRNLIDDLLDMARIESGIILRYRPVKLDVLAENVKDRLHPQAQEKAMTIEVDVPPDLPPVPADESRLTQIMSNLVSNAIKYTPPEGHVWISATINDGLVRIAIKDDGMGISPEDQAQVFARFFRVRTSETESIEGTGLGLAIVKSLVEAHGGQIGLESRLGEGSTFYFTLPLTPPPGVELEDA